MKVRPYFPRRIVFDARIVRLVLQPLEDAGHGLRQLSRHLGLDRRRSQILGVLQHLYDLGLAPLAVGQAVDGVLDEHDERDVARPDFVEQDVRFDLGRLEDLSLDQRAGERDAAVVRVLERQVRIGQPHGLLGPEFCQLLLVARSVGPFSCTRNRPLLGDSLLRRFIKLLLWLFKLLLLLLLFLGLSCDSCGCLTLVPPVVPPLRQSAQLDICISASADPEIAP